MNRNFQIKDCYLVKVKNNHYPRLLPNFYMLLFKQKSLINRLSENGVRARVNFLFAPSEPNP